VTLQTIRADGIEWPLYGAAFAHAVAGKTGHAIIVRPLQRRGSA